MPKEQQQSRKSKKQRLKGKLASSIGKIPGNRSRIISMNQNQNQNDNHNHNNDNRNLVSELAALYAQPVTASQLGVPDEKFVRPLPADDQDPSLSMGKEAGTMSDIVQSGMSFIMPDEIITKAAKMAKEATSPATTSPSSPKAASEQVATVSSPMDKRNAPSSNVKLAKSVKAAKSTKLVKKN